MSAINKLLIAVKVEAHVFHNGQYCGLWAVDTSGTRHMTFHMVSYGICHLTIGEETILLNAGDAIFFPTDASHRASNSKSKGVAVNQAVSFPMTEETKNDSTGLVCGHFVHQHPLFDKLLMQLPDYIVIRGGAGSSASAVIDLMLAESRQADQSTNMLLNRLSDCLLYILLRDHVDTESGLFSAMAHPSLGESLTLIHSNPTYKLTLDKLASAAAMSRSAYASLFKQMVGLSPADYILQWRMAQAHRWLADDGISTLDAALRCGYESEASFSKAFKRVLGVGPGVARNMYSRIQ